MTEVSALLEAANRGDRQAAADLLPVVHAERRRLAAAKLAREDPGQTLAAPAPPDGLPALAGAPERLAAGDPARAGRVKLRSSAGRTADGAAAAPGLSPSPADRHRAHARACLRRARDGDPGR